MAGLCSVFVYWFFFAAKQQISWQGAGYAIIAGMIWAIAFILFIIALKMGKASVVIAINALSAGVAVILAVLFLAESLSLVQVIGVLLAILAVVLLSV